MYNRGGEVIGFTLPKLVDIAGRPYTEQAPFYYVKDLLGNVREIVDKNGVRIVEYTYDAWGNFRYTINENYSFNNGKVTYYAMDIVRLNGFTYRSYYYDRDVEMYYLQSRYYDPAVGRFIFADEFSSLNLQSINGLNVRSYANNNPISLAYSNGSNGGNTNVSGGLVSSIGTGSPFSRTVSSSSTSKGGLNLGWFANKLDAGSTFYGLYSSASTIYNNISYFSKNLHAFSDDMTMLGASMKEGVLAFNQFNWGLGKSDILGIVLGVGMDIYDSIERGVSPGGVVLGATLTAAKGVGLIYLNKGIMYGATAIGSCFGPVGTVVGFVAGAVVCVFVDIFVSNWLDELIDSIAK